MFPAWSSFPSIPSSSSFQSLSPSPVLLFSGSSLCFHSLIPSFFFLPIPLLSRPPAYLPHLQYLHIHRPLHPHLTTTVFTIPYYSTQPSLIPLPLPSSLYLCSIITTLTITSTVAYLVIPFTFLLLLLLLLYMFLLIIQSSKPLLALLFSADHHVDDFVDMLFRKRPDEDSEKRRGRCGEFSKCFIT